MEESTKSFWWKFWGRPIRFFGWLTLLLLLVGVILARYYRMQLDEIGNWQVEKPWLVAVPIIGAACVASALCLMLSLIPATRPVTKWILRRWFFCTAIVATVIALFYAEENWRGQRAWERSKQELQAKGLVLDWDKFIPPPVPDDQNVFKAPKMQEWFVDTAGRRLSSNELTGMLQSPTNFPTWGTTRTIDTETDARAYLAWSDHLKPQFDLMREALKRPYSRMDGDYSQMLVLPIPNFIAIRGVARTLAQRAHCHLLVHEPDKAVTELALIHDLSHLTDAKPTGKPVTLVAAMINVAVTGLYADVVGKGFRTHSWQEAQLVELQQQLSDVHTIIPVATAFQSEPAATTRTLEIVPVNQIFGAEGNLLRIAPRGWVFQNMAQETPFLYTRVEGLNPDLEFVSLRPLKESHERFEKFKSHSSPFNFIARKMIPNILKAIQTTARNQSIVNEARVACALERYRFAYGQYPDTLEALVPQFIEKIPHDVINDGQLKYRRSNEGFVLYSIGWDEKDDGGTTLVMKDGRTDPASADWVWEYSAK